MTGGSYKQAPFESINKEDYTYLLDKLMGLNLDLASINWLGEEDQRGQEASCVGGACDII